MFLNLEYTITESRVLEELLNIDEEIKQAYKIKEEYLAFDQCTKDEINSISVSEHKTVIKQNKGCRGPYKK